MSFDDPDMIACAELVQRADPDRFRVAMAAPVPARLVLFPIFAANVEVSRAPWVTQEHLIAEMRLQWWKDAFEQIAAGGNVRRHEVVSPLARVLDARGAQLMLELAEVRSWDIYRDPFEDAAHFERYITASSAHLMLAAARALGDVDEQAVLDMGYAAGLANYLVAVPALEKAKRVPLLDGRPEAVQALAQDGLARLKRARAARGQVGRAAAPAMLLGWKAEAILKRAAAQPGRVAAGALAGSGFAENAGLMLRALTGRW
ncbi:squalene/phytoene synthase family protein [Thalassobius sp. S69A]|uniref:squalene/phytoene synthase family protein n=1 Tax=unclassified Thalassovita TaxID=2619711 RepID=UPI000C0F3BFD|nr:phytoene synthase [Paracoccaceae bacterium]MBT25384.1 phytoene synthase [Paracoccaceae bacterium]